ncbi:MAG: hypothetical protein ABIP94_15630 [Planctomycetota bacterium]
MHELAKAYEGKMKFEVVKYNEGDSQARIAAYELDKHGMVIADQNKAKVWSESGHKQTKEGIEAAIKKVLGE